MSTNKIVATTFSGTLAGNATTATSTYVTANATGNKALVLCTPDGTSRNETLYKDSSTSVYYNTSNNTLVCPVFSGALSGNATTATTATTASKVTHSSGRADTSEYPVLWGTATATTQAFSCANVKIKSSTGMLTAKSIKVNSSTYNDHLKIERSTESWNISPSTDGSLNITRSAGTGTAEVEVPQLYSHAAITAAGDVTAFSDARLKSNVETLDGDKVYEMRGVSFDKDDRRSSGVIAQELQKVAPELVHEGEEYLSVAYGNLVGYLIEAVKDLKAEVEELKNGATK